jgi:DNA-binding GntR family transcriptional regulator
VKSEEVYKGIREKIISGVYAPGEGITEDALGRDLKTSRTPIREALIRLHSEGLVNIIQNKGTFVRRIRPIDLAEIFQLRMILEGAAARYCVDLVDEKKIGAIKAQLEKCHKKGVEDTRKARLGLDLHALIIEYTGNQRLKEVLDQLSAQILWVRDIAARIPGRVEKSLNQHIAIADALCAKNGKLAEKNMVDHLQSSMKDVLDLRNYKFVGLSIEHV